MKTQYTQSDSEKLLKRIERTKLAQADRVTKAKEMRLDSNKNVQDLLKQCLASIK